MWCIAENSTDDTSSATVTATQRPSPSTRSSSTATPVMMPSRKTVSSQTPAPSDITKRVPSPCSVIMPPASRGETCSTWVITKTISEPIVSA